MFAFNATSKNMKLKNPVSFALNALNSIKGLRMCLTVGRQITFICKGRDRVFIKILNFLRIKYAFMVA